MAGNFSVGSITGRLKLAGKSEFVSGLASVGKYVRTWGNGLNKLLTLPFNLASYAFKGFRYTVTRGVSILSKSLRGLRRWFLNIRTAIIAATIAVGGFGLVKLAREAESLETAFKNLSVTIGGVADTFLPKLKAAVRGTISDLDLMRIANQAVLLGVAKSEDEYSNLAEMARRLGRAVGKDTVSAINDLTLGIGRQSWRILDNLGLIVKVGIANELYALSIGKTVAQLSDSEKKTAFMNATMEELRKKMTALGPDVDTLNDKWGRFTAALKDVTVVVSRGIVGSGGIFNLISTFLQENKKQIGDYANFISRSFARMVLGILDAIKKIRSSGGSILKNLLEFSIDAAGLLLEAFGIAVTNILPGIFAQIGNVVIEEVAKIAVRVAAFIQKKIPEYLQYFVSPAGKLLLDALAKTDVSAMAKNFQEDQEAIARYLGEGVERTKKQFKELIELYTSSKNKEGLKFFSDSIKAISEEMNLLGRNLRDPLSLGGTLVVDPEIQKFADFYNQIVEARKSLKEGETGALIPEQSLKESAKLLDKLKSSLIEFSKSLFELRAIEPQVAAPFATKTGALFEEVKSNSIAAYQNILKLLNVGFGPKTADELIKLGKILDSLSKFDIDKLIEKSVTIKYADEDAVDKELQKFQQKVPPLVLKVETFGLKGAEKELREFDLAFSKFSREFSPEQQKAIDGFRASYANLLREIDKRDSWVETKKVIKDVREEIEELSDESNVSAGRISELQAKINDVNRDRRKDLFGVYDKDQINQINASYDELIGKLSQIDKENKLREAVEGIGASFEEHVGSALTQAFLKGESIGKQWADITAGFFSDAMDRAVKFLRTQLERALTGIFEKLGLGAAGAGIAGGLLGLAALILHSIESKSTQTVEDFSEAINSSESVRGVVAGPTNVAISQIGDSLKQAMRTTEILLERIAIAVETGGGTGGGLRGSSSLFLSTSTPG